MTAPYNPQMTAPLNVPSKPVSGGAATGRNQKDRRYMDTFYDMHRHAGRFPNGRPWCGPREIAANRDVVPPPEDGFCIPDLMQGQYVELEDGSCDRRATLASSWSAPWVPISKYFVFNYKRKTIRFDYQRGLREENDGVAKYYRAAAKLGIQLNLRVEPGVIPHPQIVAELGEPSRMPRIFEAAIAGDAWLLGWIDEPNPLLADILGVHHSGEIVNPFIGMPRPTMTAVAQPEVVDAIISAPPSVDLVAMIAQLTQGMVAMQEQVSALSAKKQSAAKRMEHARAARTSSKAHRESPNPV